MAKSFDFGEMLAFIRTQPRYVLYGSSLIAAGVLFLIIGLVLL